MRAHLLNPRFFGVRARLLVMVAVLSLPVLIVSVEQLALYQESLRRESKTLASVESAALSLALQSWLNAHPEYSNGHAAIPGHDALDLYTRLRSQSGLAEDVAIVVVGADGTILPSSAVKTVPESSEDLLPSSSAKIADPAEMKWTDGARRMTRATTAPGSNWEVVVGEPVSPKMPAERSGLVLAVTWALTLLASAILAFWAVGRFTRPLRVLAESAARLDEEHLQSQMPVQTGDEIGALAEKFNAIAASLRNTFDELRTQGNFIEEVLDSLPLGVAVLDSSLIVRKANSAFSRFTGRDEERLEGEGIYEAAAGLGALSEVIEDVRRSRHPFVNYGLPLELMAPGGDQEDDPKSWDVIVWPVTEQSGAPGDTILILAEVSKRVRAEKLATTAFAAERARAAELESVVQQMNEGVLIVDARGRYRINPTAATMMGREPHEFRDGVEAFIEDLALRDDGGEVIPPADTPIGRAFFRGEIASDERCTLKRGDGESRVLSLSATPLYDEASRKEGAVVVFRDITEEVRSHQELVSAYDRLREHDRLKSAFLANISHELRTPLNVIIGLLQLLERDPEQPLKPLQAEAVARMERNARALRELVNDVLDYSRLESGRSAVSLQLVDIGETVRRVASEFKAESREKDVELVIDVSPELGRVLTDERKLSRVISNLVQNAVKFTGSGMVKISAAPLEERRWMLEVIDTGIGISSSELNYIFEEFRQVDDQLARSYSGMGLGLAITRKLVELLEGEISVESKPNEGSRFRITWPLQVKARTGTGSLVTPDGSETASEQNERIRARAG